MYSSSAPQTPLERQQGPLRVSFFEGLQWPAWSLVNFQPEESGKVARWFSPHLPSFLGERTGEKSPKLITAPTKVVVWRPLVNCPVPVPVIPLPPAVVVDGLVPGGLGPLPGAHAPQVQLAGGPAPRHPGAAGGVPAPQVTPGHVRHGPGAWTRGAGSQYLLT